MLLQSLAQLAENEKLIADPDFEFKPLAWIIRLDENGSLIAVEDNRQNLNVGLCDKKGRPVKPKWVGRKSLVPIQSVRTSGDAANFAVDKAEYVFGVDPANGRSDLKLLTRLNLFYEQLQRCGDVTNDPSLAVVLKFAQWLKTLSTSERTERLPKDKDFTAGELFAFRVGTDSELLHDKPSVRAYWKGVRSTPAGKAENTADRRCLISLKPVSNISIFKKVRNVPGDSSGGLSLVSFNSAAWESYGWSGVDNAPVSRESAEAVATALSRLLDPRPLNGNGESLKVRRIRLSEDTAVVFWSPEPLPEAQNILDALPALFDPPDDVADVGNLFSAVRTGVLKPLQSPAAFYAMTLTSVTGRIVVRDWFQTSVAQLQANLKQHFKDLDCVRNSIPPKGQTLRGIMRLDEIISALAAPGRESKIPTSLVAAFIHATLQGTLYPFGLLQRALLRERAEAGGDAWVDSVRRDARASLLKGVLNRRRNFDINAANSYPEILKHMDPTNTNMGYNLGALLAVLERLQAAALNNVNASLIDKYFAAASATPRNVFDRLLRNARHHAKKAQSDEKNAGHVFILERLIDELMSRFHAPTAAPDVIPANPKRMSVSPAVGIPVSLDLEQQALFVIGYHHMRRYLWMNRDERAIWETEHPDAPSAFVRKKTDDPAQAA